MPVSEARLAKIMALANGEIPDGPDPGAFTDQDWERYGAEADALVRDFCRTNTEPEELHEFARFWNWDSGNWVFEEILNNPVCEAATALLIYWHAAPEFFRQYTDANSVAAAMADVDMFEFISRIEARYVAGDFPVGRISFDPCQMGEQDGYSFVGRYDDLKDNFVRELPAVVYLPVIGQGS